ncbi:DUF3237 domain-containing protein [Solimonas marina]|uniref:UPF0311 protein G7Y82_05990 n=1 Tax=Solimonas marina TaxID=2714601 RepID=A0A970B8Y4_9GAMM|nr:DUF3237 domain-containing protein [Solimonas marina]NKF21861.1 DUF3237 domain-containing protein [Solimonas marina]
MSAGLALRGEHLFALRAQLQAPPEVIGPVPEGLRMTFYIAGGRVDGPRLRGRLRASGADWFTLRRDGVGQLDVRGTIETDDGALIQIDYAGLADAGEGAYENVVGGALPPRLTLRTGPRLRSAHPAYQWLHRLYCVGIGEADLQTFEVRYDIYALP